MNNELIAAQREVRIQEAIIVKQDEIIASLKQGNTSRDEALGLLHGIVEEMENDFKENERCLNNVVDAQAAFIELLQEQLIASGNNIVAEAKATIKAPVLH